MQVMDSTERLQGYVKAQVKTRHGRETLADAGVQRRPAEREGSRRLDRAISGHCAEQRQVVQPLQETACGRATQIRSRRLLAACGVVLVRSRAGPAHSRNREPVTSDRLAAGHKDPSQWLMFGGDYTAPAAQSAHPGHAAERESARPPVDLPDRNPRRVRDDHARPRRRALRHRAEQLRLGARRENRQVVLALPPDAARRPAGLLRPGQPRLRDARQPAVHDDARRPPHRARRAEPGRSSGTSSSRTTRKAMRRRSRRSSSRTRSWSAWPEASTGRQDSSPRSTSRAASACGNSTRCRRAGEFGSETWAGDSAERGGGGVWVTGSYDPALNLLYLRHRQPLTRLPWRQPAGRQPVHQLAGGARRRHRQAALALPVHAARHARLGLDPRADPRRADDRRPRTAGRDGRQSQRLLLHDRSHQRASCWSPSRTCTPPGRRRSARDGRPVLLPDNTPDEKGSMTCPDLSGGTNFYVPSFDPKLRVFFVNARETCATYFGWKSEFKVGEWFLGGATQKATGPQGHFGALRAIDPATGEPQVGGPLSGARHGRRHDDRVGPGVHRRRQRQRARHRLASAASCSGIIRWAHRCTGPRRRPTCSTAASSCSCRPAGPSSRLRCRRPGLLGPARGGPEVRLRLRI